MIVHTIFRLNRNRTRYNNVDDLKIKNGWWIEKDVLGCVGKESGWVEEGDGGGRGWGRKGMWDEGGIGETDDGVRRD